MSDQHDKKPTKRLNQAIDADVHRRLKVYAAENDLTIPQAIEALLRDALGLKRDPPRCHA